MFLRIYRVKYSQLASQIFARTGSTPSSYEVAQSRAKKQHKKICLFQIRFVRPSAYWLHAVKYNIATNLLRMRALQVPPYMNAAGIFFV